ncbi:MAG: hypothetical protein WDZ76_09905 [Pseudohongiellaceae bacterium]
MGLSIEKTEFTSSDYQQFDSRLRENLRALAQLLDTEGFGEGPPSFGAELEMYIIDGEGRPLGINREIQQAFPGRGLTLELNRFNLEYNLPPFAIADSPFGNSERDLLDALIKIRKSAARFGGRVVPIGILPTLRFEDFGSNTMTDLPRYHALRNRLKQDRGGPFTVYIRGEDELALESDDITLEGANTSFQIHYRVRPKDFADTFNAVQLLTPLLVAIACNSPTFLGRRLWQETRIPLFKKSIDCRKEQLLMDKPWHQPPRVNFGHGWVREGIYELFAETARLYPCLLPITSEENSVAMVAAGKVPGLSELRLQQGTVWLWNRPIFDDSDGGHVRIEMRALPSGPTVVDMMANAAFAVGLAEALRPRIRELITALPFGYANYNFYRAAEYGLGAQVIWPDLKRSELQERSVIELLNELLPLAYEGLGNIGISDRESAYYLGVIEKRLNRNMTASIWQLKCLDRLQQHTDTPAAYYRMLELYCRQSEDNVPVAEWLLDE